MKKHQQVFNPFLPQYEYIPDGEPHIFGERVYLYGSHDRFGGNAYCMNDYVCYSADVHNLAEWRQEGIIYHKGDDPRNPEATHCLWAPDVIRGQDGRYYLYYCFDTLPEIGVAVSDTPAGLYQYLGLVHYPDLTVLGRREGDYIQFDPGVFIEDDGEIYLYSGNAPRTMEDTARKNSQVMRLEKDMLTIKAGPYELLPAIRNSKGTGFEGHEFFEASSIRKINGKYYLVYSDINSYSLCYAISDKPDQGYRYGGILISLGDIGYGNRSVPQARNALGNIHGGMEYINGQWYIFYHRQTNRTQYSRQACAEKITILPDGKIKQAEMTSCGLNNSPLNGFGEYMAAIACNLWAADGGVFSSPTRMDDRYPYFTQDGQDTEEDANQYIANIRDGAVAGYKYFDFQDLHMISITVRGNGQGKFIIATEENGDVRGEITISINSADWIKFDTLINIRNGVSALFFKYFGVGSLDFLKFELLSN